MKTVFGLACDSTGVAGKTVLTQGERRPELRFQGFATPSFEFRSVQDPRIPIDRDHDHHWVGEIIYLERSEAGALWAVGHVADEIEQAVHVRVADATVAVEHDLFWSLETIGGGGDGFLIVAVALTASPARVAATPVKLLEGVLDHRSAPERWQLESHERDLLTRAAASYLDRRRDGGPIVVHDLGGGPQAREHGREARHAIEVRSATAVDVSASRRELDVIIAPAETPTVINERGRQYVETFAHGAFDGVSADRVRVNMHHLREKVVGRAVALDAWDEAGLVGTLRISRTRDGDEALALAEDGCLDVSAGFAVAPSGEQWHDGRRLRRVIKATLDHVALTPDPAYVDARVLAVRSHV